MRYLVTQEIKSSARVGRSLYVQDFFFLIVYAGLTALLASLVNGRLLIPYWIFSSIMGFSLTAGSWKNKKRRNLQSILLLLRKDRSVYRPIQAPGRTVEEEAQDG